MTASEEKRLELHEILCNILGSRNVYFQPPESLKMHYPAIRYARARFANEHANNNVYLQNVVYNITVIEKDPDGTIAAKIANLPNCRSDRSYVAENLNHDTFVLHW